MATDVTLIFWLDNLDARNGGGGWRVEGGGGGGGGGRGECVFEIGGLNLSTNYEL